MKIVFAGSPEFVFPVLEFLAGEHEVVAVMTNAPTETGRGRKVKASPLAIRLACYCGENQGAPIAEALRAAELLEVERIDEEVMGKVSGLGADLLVCYAFGKIFSERFLGLFGRGGINVHPSLLPRWRGATPVPASILAGDVETGVSVQTLVKRMDAGNILAQSSYQMKGDETTESLLALLTERSVPLLRQVLRDFDKALANGRPQDEAKATYCSKLVRAPIDWNRSNIEIERLVRGLFPNPKAFALLNGEHITITQARLVSAAKGLVGEPGAPSGTVTRIDKQLGIIVQTGYGELAIQRLQRQGKKELFWKDFLNGFSNIVGQRFG